LPDRNRSPVFHGRQYAEKIEPCLRNCSPAGDSIVVAHVSATLRVEHVLVR
jgi:hypothetical protein